MGNAKLESEGNLFEELGLSVAHGPVEVGSTYPIFGMITKLTNETPGSVVVEINHNITARMNVTEESRVELLRKRAFETGIFISKVTSVEPDLVVECQAVIFGKNQAYNA